MKRLLTVTTVLLSLLLAACSSTRGSEPEATDQPAATDSSTIGATIGGRAELISALEAAGATVSEGEAIADPFFAVEAAFLTVNGAQVQVYEFPDEAARQVAQETVNATGNIIGNMTVDWAEQASFFGMGRVIALYAGDDQAMLELLTGILGEPFAQATGGFMVPDQSPAVAAALVRLAEEAAVAAEEISVTSVEEMDWPDGCLGLGGPDEGCLAVIVPGLKIMVQVGEREFEIRTDATGETVRWQEVE